MNFIYLDPGLHGYGGHHATFCNHLTSGLRRRGHQVKIYGSRYAARALEQELGVVPWFVSFPYSNYIPKHETEFDPICGWLNAFELSWQATVADLNSLPALGKDDVIYWGSAFAPQVVALARWLQQLSPDSRPRAVVELNIDSGVIATRDEDGREHFAVPDPRDNERPMLWRYAGILLRQPDLRGLIQLINFEPSTLAAYEYLLKQPVAPWIPPFNHSGKVHSRAGKRGFAIGILGSQRKEKGFELVPRIVEQILSVRRDVAVLVHNSMPDFMSVTQNELRRLAHSHNRLVLREGALSPAAWLETVAACDLMLCPYDPDAFRTRCSGMLNESVAHAIPVVVPANTSLSRLFSEWGSPGATFNQWQPETIAAAVHQVLDNYDLYAERAFAASQLWDREHSVERLVDAMLEWAGAPQPNELVHAR